MKRHSIYGDMNVENNFEKSINASNTSTKSYIQN